MLLKTRVAERGSAGFTIPNILERESKRKNAGLQPGKRLQSGKGIF